MRCLPLLFLPLSLLLLNDAPAHAQGSTSTSYVLAYGGLNVGVTAPYPAGTWKPMWQIADNGIPIDFALTNKVAGALTNRETKRIQIADLNRRPVLVFDFAAGRRCAALLAPVPVVISNIPQQFTMSNFISIDDDGKPCAAASAYVRSWKGALTLSADADGNLLMDLSLNAFSDRGKLSYSWDVQHYALPNEHSPAWATQQIAQQKAADQQHAVQAAKAAAANEDLLRPAAARCLAGKPRSADIATVVNARMLCNAAEDLIPAGRPRDTLNTAIDQQVAQADLSVFAYLYPRDPDLTISWLDVTLPNIQTLKLHGVDISALSSQADALVKLASGPHHTVPDSSPSGLCMVIDAFPHREKLNDDLQLTLRQSTKWETACRETYRLHPLPAVAYRMASAVAWVGASYSALHNVPAAEAHLKESRDWTAIANKGGLGMSNEQANLIGGLSAEIDSSRSFGARTSSLTDEQRSANHEQNITDRNNDNIQRQAERQSRQDQPQP